jgi:hypothetical protein
MGCFNDESSGDPRRRGHVNALRASGFGQRRFAVTAGSARRATSADPRTDGHFARPSFAILLDLKDSDKAKGKDDAWESCGVMGHHDIERNPRHLLSSMARTSPSYGDRSIRRGVKAIVWANDAGHADQVARG